MLRISAVLSSVFVAACVGGGVDLSTDAFAGTWACGDVNIIMTPAMITIDEDVRQIAYVERGGNADFGLTATDGKRFSVFDTKRNSLTFVIHEDRETLECVRMRA